MTKNRDIRHELEHRILLLDGGFGTMIQQYGLDEADYRGKEFAASEKLLRGCNDLLNLTRPETIREIHEKYLQAGSDVITSNTFNANSISLADYGLAAEAYRINRAGAAIAREAADAFTARNPQKPRFVGGSMGPTSHTLSMSADVDNPGARAFTFEQLSQAYYNQARGLMDGGADLLMLETVFDALNAKAAIFAIETLFAERGMRLPVIVSSTLTSSGRTLAGQTIEAFYTSVAHAEPLAVSLNCSFGAKALLPYLERLAAVSEFRVAVYPNAGLPNVMGGYDETPAMFAADVEEYMRRGLVNLVGGCCGTTPLHIFELAKIVNNYTPRPLPQRRHVTCLSGLEQLRIVPEANFVNVGERTNVAGSAKFARLIREKNYEEALSVARAQVEAGANIVDVCMDDGLIDGPEAMRDFLNLMGSEPEIAAVPVMIDSSKWEVLETGLRVVQGKSVVNSISLKEGEQEFLHRARLIRRYGAAAVVMLFDEQGQADTYARKIDVAQRAYKLLTDDGFPAEDIIFDPNILAVATGIEAHDAYARDFIEAVRWIKRNLPHAKISGGVSNLSFAFRGNNAVREAMHSVFLYHAIQAGMDMAIVNPQMLQIYSDIEPGLLERSRMLSSAAAQTPPNASRNTPRNSPKPARRRRSIPDAWRSEPLGKRIEYAMLKGVADYIEQDALEGYRTLGSPLAVIDQLLMPAMEVVGNLFGQGKMFLPQVVKTARVMKKAVAVLTPYIEQGSEANAKSAGKVLVATVKGDVHDIGKNIVAVVMACNGYTIRDLGVMVECPRIIDEAVAWGADAICLSGLITPSLEEMIHVCEELERRGLQIPVLIGGATTSDVHTAVKIAPTYSGPVIHADNASRNNKILGELLGPGREEYLARVREEQQTLRDQYRRREEIRTILPFGQVRKLRVPKPASEIAVPAHTGRLVFPDISIADVEPLIDWNFFFPAWGLKGRVPEIFENPEHGRRSPQALRRRAKDAGPHPRRKTPHPPGRSGHLRSRQPGRRHRGHRPERQEIHPADAAQPGPGPGSPGPLSGRFHRRRKGRQDRLYRGLRPHGRHRAQGADRKVPRGGRRLQRHPLEAAGRPPDRSPLRMGAYLHPPPDVGLRNRSGAHTRTDHPQQIPGSAHGLRLPGLSRPLAQTRGLRPAGRRQDDRHAPERQLYDYARGGALRPVLRRRRIFLRRTNRPRTTGRLLRTPRHGHRNDRKTDTQ